MVYMISDPYERQIAIERAFASQWAAGFIETAANETGVHQVQRLGVSEFEE